MAKLLNLYSFSSASAIAMRLSRAPGLKYVPAVVVELVAAGLKYVLAVVVACVPPAPEVPGPPALGETCKGMLGKCP